MRILWGIFFGLYVVLYLSNAMAPEASPDGAGYHLGLVARYLREHGFVRITDNLYAAMPAGVEMLFLFAFAFGRHSAAALVHFAFLVALVWQVFSYGRRSGFPVAGACAALLVFASPVVGIDGTSAYNDVAVAAIAFTLFYLLQVWDEDRTWRLAAAIGLVAGFAFAAKYTAWPAVIYAAGLRASERPQGRLSGGWLRRRRDRALALEELDLLPQPGGAVLQPSVSQSLRHGGFRGHVSQAAGHVPSEIALADPHGGDYLWIAFGLVGTGASCWLPWG